MNLLPRIFRSSVFTLVLTLGVNTGWTTDFIRLKGSLPHKAVADAVLAERLDSNAKINFTFVLPLRNQEELETLIHRIYDPTDHEHYGKYLTSSEFNERFAPSEEDYEHVIAYVQKQDLAISGKHPNRILLNVQGTADAIEKVFSVNLHSYSKPDGTNFHAPDYDPEVPSHIGGVISGIVGLDNAAVWKPHYRIKEASESSLDSHDKSHAFPSGPSGGFAPSDLAVAYNLSGLPANGAGQAIALFELAGYQVSDINAYTDQFGLPRGSLIDVKVDGGSTSGIDAEVTLDIQLALSIAPQSTIYVYEGPNSNQGVLDTYNKIATDNIAKQVSTSWGMAEDLSTQQYLQAENTIFMQMAAQGQSMYAAAGDSGAYDDSNSDKLAVDDPGFTTLRNICRWNQLNCRFNNWSLCKRICMG